MSARHFNIPLMRRRRYGGGVVLRSLAEILALGETEALALDFTDDFFYATTSLYGSAWVLDTGTPANNYNSIPYNLLTYTSPSLKMVMGPNGTLGFGAHNIYLNSASPADQSVTVISGATYSITLTGSVSITLSGAATGTITAGTTSFTAASGTLTCGSTSGSGTVHLRRTPVHTDTYLPTTSAARYALPYEWDVNGDPLGLLVEGQRTNLFTYSEQINIVDWTISGVTVTANTTTAPDGTVTADTMTASTGLYCYARQSPTLTQNQTYTATFFLKYNNCQWVWLLGNTSTDAFAWFDIQNGATGNADAGVTSSIASVGNGWYRCTIIFTNTSTTGPQEIGVGFADSNGAFGGTNGQTVYIWGAQLELGSFPTSYIPTIGSTVTRAADNITLATSATPFLNTVGTIYAAIGPGVRVANGRIVAIDDGSSSARVMDLFQGTSTRIDAYTIGTGFSGIQAVGTISTSAYKVAAAYALNDYAAVSDGGTVVTDATASVGIAGTGFYIGKLGTGSQLNGHIQKIMYVPRRVSNADLQTLTGTGVLPAP